MLCCGRAGWCKTEGMPDLVRCPRCKRNPGKGREIDRMYVAAGILEWSEVGFWRGGEHLGLCPLCEGAGLATAEDAAAWSLLSVGPQGEFKGMLATEEAALLNGVSRRRAGKLDPP